MNGGDPNRVAYFQKVLRIVELLGLVWRLDRLVTSRRFHADVRFGYRHVILHALPAAGIAVH